MTRRLISQARLQNKNTGGDPAGSSCGAAAKRRTRIVETRKALLFSETDSCAIPGFENNFAGGVGTSRNGAHWTSRPVGTCKFRNMVAIDGSFFFVFGDTNSLIAPSATKHRTLKVPRVRLSPYDDSTSVYCNPIEKNVPGRVNPGSSRKADDTSDVELLPIRAIHVDALSAVLVRFSRPVMSLSAIESGTGESSPVQVVVPLRRVHAENHGHMYMDAAAPTHWALDLVKHPL